MKTGLFCTLALIALTGPAAAQDVVSGTARVVGADLISFENNQRVVLFGVDAPERDQTCFSFGERYNCYEESAAALGKLLEAGKVTCELTGKPDPFGRRMGTCTIGELDIGAEMVRLGQALAYLDESDAYTAQQDEATAAQVGLWREGVEFTNPWDWRKRNPGLAR